MNVRNELKIICVDFQEDFTNPKGKKFSRGESIGFVKNEFVPFLKENDILIYEIVSDYRYVFNKRPRKGDTRLLCDPDSFGYASEIPSNVKINDKMWVKSMNSPIWIRENGGEKGKLPGEPYQAPDIFDKWLNDTIGPPESIKDHVLVIGLTLDCCVLCLLQELFWRGYKTKVLYEATDPRGQTLEEIKRNKEWMCFQHSSVKIFSEFTFWKDEKERILGILKDEKNQ